MTPRAEVFRRLHDGPGVLLLANAWDAGSARLLESLGARAIATTSAGVAWAHGYPDGDALPADLLLASTRLIARVVGVPVSVDVEAGYSDDPDAVGALVAALVDAGAAGINLEDASGPADGLAAKIEAVKREVGRRGGDVFVNARTDVFLRGLVPEAGRVAETLARARLYRESGADGFFVPKVVAAGEMREIAASAGLPLNVLAWPGVPAATELAALGVRRLSAGSGIAQNAWRRAASLAAGFLRDGRSEPLQGEHMPYGEINALFATPKT